MNANKELVTLRLFSPLKAYLYSPEDRYCSGEPEELSDDKLCAYEKEIQSRTAGDDYEMGEGGMVGCLEDKELSAKIYSINRTVEVWDGRLWGVAEVRSFGRLPKEDVDRLIKEWEIAVRDGWGDTFAQCPVKTQNGRLCVEFWYYGSDFFIKTEERLKSTGNQTVTMQMGGM